MTSKQKINYITKWIKSYATKNKISSLVVGISGGIDSSVVSDKGLKLNAGVYVVQVGKRKFARVHLSP